MKKTKLMLCICALSFTMVMGCSSKDTIDEPEDITVTPEAEGNESEEKSEDVETTLALADNTEKQFADISNEEVPETNIDVSKFTDEMEGEVRSINPAEKLVVVSKIYGDSQIAVAPAPGSDDEELVTIYFTNEAKYILETGKSDGSNVKQEEADFSKIEEGDTIQLKGLENIIGTEFLATDVKIIRVIN